MTLDVKGVVYSRVNVQEALRRARRLETLLFALSSSDWLMRVLGTIIRTLIIDVFSRQAKDSNCDVVRFEFVGCDPGWRPPLFLQQFTHQLQRCLGVPL
jgi:hypothetical protein